MTKFYKKYVDEDTWHEVDEDNVRKYLTDNVVDIEKAIDGLTLGLVYRTPVALYCGVLDTEDTGLKAVTV